MSVTLAELTENLYGVKTTYVINELVTQVGASIVKILRNRPNRVSFLVVNLSANSLYISPNNDVSSSNGIYVAANGGSVVFQWDRDFELVLNDWYAIAGGAASDVYILENISI